MTSTGAGSGTRVGTPGRREVRFAPVGEGALLVEFADVISDVATARVRALDAALGRAQQSDAIVGLCEVVPALVNVLVVFDPILTDHPTIEAAIATLLDHPDADEAEPADRQVHVCYDESVSPDLQVVADACDLSVEAVIAAHLAGDYRVLMYGFAPGYAYLGGVPETIRVPRKSAAVRGVAAGSVIIAGPQCLVTTIEMPTGWSIIGSSPTSIIDASSVHPFLFDVGDRVRFERIDLATHTRLLGSPAR